MSILHHAIPHQGDQQRRVLRWASIIAAVMATAGALAYAETGWLANRIPQDRPARVALVAYVDPSQGTGALPANYGQVLVQEAQNPALLQQVASTVSASNGSAAQQLSGQEIASHMSLGARCVRIEPLEVGDKGFQAVLLYNVFRGPDPKQTEELAQAWSRAFTSQATGEQPGLVLKPADAIGLPYEMCS